MLMEGMSIRATSRITGVHKTTILALLIHAGQRCERLLAEKMRGIPAERLELDEIWTFVQKKQKRVRFGEPEEFGDQFVFVAIDPVTKLVPCFAVGKRNAATAWPFVQELRERTTGAPQITTDGFRPYIRAIDDAFGADVDYAVLVKSFGTSQDGAGTYHPSRIVAVFHQVMFGDPEPRFISTSIVERNNLTMRMQMRRFTRLTNAHSKRLANLKATLALHFAWYNFVRIHSSLRVTPAMEAGLTDHVGRFEELISWKGETNRAKPAIHDRNNDLGQYPEVG
jgi:IS1 family transposase